MASKRATLGGAALAVLLVSSFSIPADARHGGGGGGHGWGGGHVGHMGGMAHAPLAHSGAHFAHRPFIHDRRIHRRVFVTAPAYGAYYYGDGCYWLRRNALYTGSSYWWSRYYECINGYGY